MFWRRNSATRKRRKDAGGWALRVPALPWRRIASTSVVVLVALAGVMAVRFAFDQPVQNVSITGRFQRVQPPDVERTIRGAVGQSGLISVDPAAVARAIEQIPWVDRASVARAWPRGLAVDVTEQRPVARWGETGLVNMRGEVFVHDLRHIPAELPELVGPPGYEAQMTERYLTAHALLTEAGMRVTRLQLDERGAWELALDNGVTLRLGRQGVDERFERFLTAAAGIVATRSAEIAYVDMRYANGFAIGWRAGANGVKRG